MVWRAFVIASAIVVVLSLALHVRIGVVYRIHSIGNAVPASTAYPNMYDCDSNRGSYEHFSGLLFPYYGHPRLRRELTYCSSEYALLWGR